MRALTVEVLPNVRATGPRFPVDKTIRDALAEHFRREYPANATKLLARDFGLSIDEARGVLEGRSSLKTLDQIFKHPKGGWPLLLPVMSAVIGESIDQHISKQRSEHAEQDRRRDALLRGLRAGNDASSLAGY